MFTVNIYFVRVKAMYNANARLPGAWERFPPWTRTRAFVGVIVGSLLEQIFFLTLEQASPGFGWSFLLSNLVTI